MDKKRLFFGMEVRAPWPEELPKGRVIDESFRHITLAFLGETDYSQLKEQLSSLPLPPFRVGSVGHFSELLFLPKYHPRVVAWHPLFLSKLTQLEQYQKELSECLVRAGFSVSHSERDWLPHVTIARAPFHEKAWKEVFSPLPLITTHLHLYESFGHLQYKSIWHHPILSPFEEIPHTADLAYRILGSDLQELYLHAQIALAFSFPALLTYLDSQSINTIDDIVVGLNRVVAQADTIEGAPVKAVSYHGEANERSDQLIEWEMIVDV